MSIKTADRTLELLELFAREKAPRNVSEIASRMRMPVSSAHGLVKTLEAMGYLFETARRKGYYPTGKLRDLAERISQGVSPLQLMGPLLQELRDTTLETALLARQQGACGIYVDVRDSPHSMRFAPAIGEIKPLHSTATGRALLSALPDDALAAAVEALPMQAVTEYTVTDRAELLRRIRQGVELGWQCVFGENVPDLMSIARHVRFGGEDYAIGLAGSLTRFEPLIEQHARALLDTCRRIEALPSAAGARPPGGGSG